MECCKCGIKLKLTLENYPIGQERIYCVKCKKELNVWLKEADRQLQAQYPKHEHHKIINPGYGKHDRPYIAQHGVNGLETQDHLDSFELNGYLEPEDKPTPLYDIYNDNR